MAVIDPIHPITRLMSRAASVGAVAFEILAEDGPARVLSTTSRGIFIRTGQRLIFLSFERWRGPLSLTLNDSLDRFRMLPPGTRAFVAGGRLIFPPADITLVTEATDVWRPGPTGEPIHPPAKRLSLLRDLAGEILVSRGDVGLGAWLPPLLDTAPNINHAGSGLSVLSTLLQLRTSLHTDPSRAAEVACGLLGVGRGLTPSGDDVIAGLLLTLNRWQTLWPTLNLARLNQPIVAAASHRTTTLSASLIACAASGQADERLVDVIDYLVADRAPATDSPSEYVGRLLEWGASSGVDALVGMTLALTG